METGFVHGSGLKAFFFVEEPCADVGGEFENFGSADFLEDIARDGGVEEAVG